jgi:hypothetical protein
VEAPHIVRAARMLQGYELMFWDTLYALSTEEVQARTDGLMPPSLAPVER